MTAGSVTTDASAVLRGLPSEWTVVHDGSTAGSADADHVVVGPGGIFLVSVRDRPGPSYALAREDDTIACSGAADVVAEMAGAYARRVRPVLCIVGDAELLEQALDVLVCSTATLATALTSAPVVLAATQCDEAVALLGGVPAAEETAPLPVPEAPRGKRARVVEPDSEPDLVAATVEAPRGKRARALDPEPEPDPEPDPELLPEPVPDQVAPEPPLPTISVPMISTPPQPRPEPVEAVVPDEPVEAAVPDEPAEPEVQLTGRAKRVAEAMATRDAHAAKLAELQGKDGSAASAAKAKATGRVAKVVKLLVAAAVVGVLALNGPHLVSTADTWGPNLWAQLNGKSGSASACAPAAAAPTVALRPAASKPTSKKATATASRSRAGRKADARKKRQRQKAAAATPRTPALESPVC